MKIESSKVDAPNYSSDGAAGMDIRSAESVLIQPWTRELISTGLRMELPEGTYGRIAPRSGLAVKHGIDVGAGVVDSDYRGEVKVILFNLSNEPFCVVKGDRIAQLIVQPYVRVVTSTAGSTRERGEGGFGSTGVN